MKPIESVASFMLRALGGNAFKQRYNEAIADGFLPCAPSTKIGEDRKLDTVDVFGAAIFEQCLSFGFNARKAGEYTCLAVDAIRAYGSFKILKVVIFQKGKSKVALCVGHVSELFEIEAVITLSFDMDAITDVVNRILEKRAE